MKYIKYVREHFNDSKFPVFTLYDLKTSLRARGISDAYLKRLVNVLLKKKEAKRITKGVYTFYDDATVAGFAYQPFYYGLEDALRARDLSEQGTNPCIITTRNVRTGIRKFEGRNYVVRRIPENLFFGYELIKYYDFWIPVSDVEKTIIDMFYFKDYIRDELWPDILKVLDKKKLHKYLKSYRQDLRNKVLKAVNKN